VNSGLRDRVGRGVRVLFVGINPGVRSAAIGHHFAGYSNRFWKLLYDASLVPEPIGTEDDYRLLEWRFGITNLIPRTTPGIDTLRLEEYEAGLRALRRKVRRWKPKIVAFVGVTLFRFVAARPASARVGVGLQVDRSKALACSCYRTPVAATRTSRTWRCSPPIDRLRLSCTMFRIRTHHTPIRPQECRE
jgi:double-stranded uracil-DNA glycosylase